MLIKKFWKEILSFSIECFFGYNEGEKYLVS